MLNRFGSAQLVVATTLLLGFGIVMVYSASAARAEVLFGSSFEYVLRQSGALALGLGACALCFAIPLALLERLAYPAYALGLALLLAVLSPLGTGGNGAQRWLVLGPLTFQPLELVKLSVILALARWLASNKQRLHDFRISLGVPALLAGAPVVLLLLQPDFGGSMLILLFTAVLVFVAGARLDHLASTAAILTPLAGAVLLMRDYRVSRLIAFLDPWADPQGRGYQLVQSQLAFGAGGWFGSGLGAGQQKLFFLPEAHNDFILSVVGEELGLVGVFGVLVCFSLLALGALGIAQRARTPFATLVTLGASLMLWLQALLNGGVATGLLPTKGSTLPLLSYGGTSLVATLAAIGLILNAARPSKPGRSGWR